MGERTASRPRRLFRARFPAFCRVRNSNPREQQPRLFLQLLSSNATILAFSRRMASISSGCSHVSVYSSSV